jgi:hypothetical protein
MSKSIFSKTIPKTISTSNTAKQTIPDFSIQNPLDKDIFVNSIEIVPDPAFSYKGVLQINLNGAPIFPPNIAGFFSQYTRFSIPLPNKVLLNSMSLDIFVWDGIDNAPVTVSLSVTISESPDDLSPPNAVSQISLFSPSVIVFPYQLRAVGVYTANLDLSGYKKIIVLISAAGYVVPVSITGLQSPVHYSNLGNMIDGNLNTFGALLGQALGESVSVVVDFGNVALRQAAVSLGSSAGGTFTTSLQVSTDNVTYVNAAGQQNFRYIKFTMTNTSGTQVTDLNVNEIYDALSFGGTASVSFEAKEESSGQFIEILSAATLGTISQGQSVAKQIGDTMALTNLNNILPSNYSDLRLKLTISTSSIQNSVSILKVV